MQRFCVSREYVDSDTCALVLNILSDTPSIYPMSLVDGVFEIDVEAPLPVGYVFLADYHSRPQVVLDPTAPVERIKDPLDWCGTTSEGIDLRTVREISCRYLSIAVANEPKQRFAADDGDWL